MGSADAQQMGASYGVPAAAGDGGAEAVADNTNAPAGQVTEGADTTAAEPAAPDVAASAPAGGGGMTAIATEVAPAVTGSARIENILDECIKRNASDIHIQVGLKPILRVDGALVALENYPVLSEELVEELVFAVMDEEQKDIVIKDKELDFSFAFGELGRFRVNAFHEKGNMAAAFRLIPTKIQTLDSLNMPPVIGTFTEFPMGLVLVTGPTGSGKSTTLAALVDKINTERATHIITIEDPIEFTHKSKKSVVVQREVHYDTLSFAAALRSALREDPDVVLIGEMRDLETISAAITMAETGHLVFATLHTNSAAQSIDRLIDVFPAHQQPQVRSQLANILQAICSQRLVPATAGGRMVVMEILLANPAVRSIVREGKTQMLDTVIQTGADVGMQTFDRTLAKFVKEGKISLDSAREYAVDAAEFERIAQE
jgi:twitching motility protein PilT